LCQLRWVLDKFFFGVAFFKTGLVLSGFVVVRFSAVVVGNSWDIEGNANINNINMRRKRFRGI
jgi:hypothetical protein